MHACSFGGMHDGLHHGLHVASVHFHMHTRCVTLTSKPPFAFCMWLTRHEMRVLIPRMQCVDAGWCLGMVPL